MTPQWMQNHSIITGPHAFHLQYVDIPRTTGAEWQHALRVQLVPPGILSTTDSVIVTITIAMDTALADSSDHDPTFSISDESSFIGFTQADKSNYCSQSPCFFMEGDKGDKIVTNWKRGGGSLVASRKYSSEIKLQFRPTEQWGSCHTEHDEGYTNIANFQHLL